MAQTNYTPISLYYSATASATPSAGNLVAGELAINTNDGKLFYKDSSGVVQTLASKATTSGTFTSITDSGLTSGRVTYASTGGLLTDSANLTFDGNSLTLGNGTYATTSKLNGSSSGTGGGAALYFQNTGTTNFAIGNYSTIIGGAYNIDAIYYLGTANNHLFYTNAAERMRITSAGNVGIGTTTPAAQLEIAGYPNATFRIGDGGSGTYEFARKASDGYLHQKDVSGSYGFIWEIASSEKMRIDSSGNWSVGNSGIGIANLNSIQYSVSNAQGYITHVNGTSSGQGYWIFGYNGSQIGSITQNGTTGVLYNLTSDYRLKDNPQPLTGASEFIMALQPKTWDWWDGSGKGVGFIAHEFMEVAKYSGNGTKDEIDADGKPVYQSIQPSSSEVMANLVALVQEQQAIIEQLKEKVGL